MEAMKNLEKRVKRYLPVELDVDTSYLNNTQVHLARQWMQKVCLITLFISGASSWISDQCCCLHGWHLRDPGGSLMSHVTHKTPNKTLTNNQVWKGSKDKKDQLEDEASWNKLARFSSFPQFFLFLCSTLGSFCFFARLQLKYWEIMKGPWDR